VTRTKYRNSFCVAR